MTAIPLLSLLAKDATGQASSDVVPVVGGELAYGEAPGLLRLNPHANVRQNGPTDRLLSMIYEPLFRFNFGWERWENVLASSITAIAPRFRDGAAFAVELKTNVTWHDGSPFTATDVILTYDYLRTTAANRQIRQRTAERLLEVRRGASERQVIFEFRGSVADARPFLQHLVIPAARFSRPGLAPVGTTLDDRPLGTGPYQFVEFQSGNPVLRAYQRYHGAKGNLAMIRSREYPDESSMVETLLSATGDIGMVVEVPPEHIGRIEASRGVTLGSLDTYGVNALAMRPRGPTSPLLNERVRRAITMAINREQILENWFRNKGQLIGSPVGTAALFYDPEVTPLPFDSAAARRDLEAAGAKGSKMILIYEAAEGARDTRTGNIVKSISEALEAVGLVIEERPLRAQEFGAALYERREFDLAWVRWEFDPGYDITELFHSAYRGPGGHNYMDFSDSEVDRLLTEYRLSGDDSRKQNLLYRVQRILNQKAPAVFVSDEKKSYAHRNRLVVEPVDPFYFFTYATQWWLSGR